MRIFRKYFLLLFFGLPLISVAQDVKTGTVKITFINAINDTSIVLNEKTYTNKFSEQYTISKLEYYISHVSLNGAVPFTEGNVFVATNDTYHLINETDSNSKSFLFTAAAGSYEGLSFLIGVDSLMNVSGAQSGPLDPLNGMFWTWNSGYIMFKLEGTSPQSTVINNKIEYHIGGFSGMNNVLRRNYLLAASGFEIRGGKTTEIIIEADIAKLWQSAYPLKISETPVCTIPGNRASHIADNYNTMFFIKNILYN